MLELSPCVVGESVIAGDPEVYYAWPGIARLANGQVLVVVYEGEAHTHSHGRVVLYRSNDEGLSWGTGETIADTMLDDRDPGILVTRDDMIVVTSRVAWWKGHESAGFDPAVAKSLMARFQRGYLIRSDDGGSTWSDPCRYPFQPKAPIELRGGGLFAVSQTEQGFAGHVSHDHGETWHLVRELPVLPAAMEVAGEEIPMLYGEPHCAQMPDGRLFCFFRAHMRYGFRGRFPYDAPWNQTALMWQVWSDDGGVSWSSPRQTPLWGFPPHLLLLEDGRLLVTYGRRWPPYGQRASLSLDGVTFGSEWVVSADAPDHDLGYPSSALLGDGVIGTVYYQKQHSSCKPCLKMTRWRLPKA